MKLCKTMQTFMNFVDRFPNHYNEIIMMFNYKLNELTEPELWENK